MIARTPAPPYVAVIFSSLRAEGQEDYAAVAERMLELAQAQPGFLGVESARDAKGFGITVSYWADEAAALAWRAQGEHLEAQRMGRERFYSSYALRVAVVSRQQFRGAE
jgi:heme-degrading monooxygenase HmoA